ncbi:MAG TPA: SHOCT domain-containing protein [Limnochordales bacterium]
MWWGCGPGMWGGNWMGGSWWLGWLMMLLFWGLAIGGIVWLVKTLVTGGAGSTERGRALAILEERFARGELSEDEFRRMRDELRQAHR